MCGAPVAGRWRFYDRQECADRFNALPRAQRDGVRRDHEAEQAPPPASAGEILSDMTAEAVMWRLERRRRLARSAA